MTYNEPQGMQGRVVVRDASLSVPEAETSRAGGGAGGHRGHRRPLDQPGERFGAHRREAERGDRGQLRSGSAAVAGFENHHARIERRSHALFRAGGDPAAGTDAARLPTWRGWARYQGGDWSGESELQNARIALDGLAEPLLIKSASVSLNGKRVAVNRLQAKAGAIAFTGSYRWEHGPGSSGKVRPDKFDLKIDEADAVELSRLFAPALLRDRGFLARTLRLGANAPVPAWLKAIRTEGAVSIGSLTAGDLRLHGVTAQVKWNGPVVHLTELSGSSDPAEFAGDLGIDLSAGTSALPLRRESDGHRL